MKDKVEYNTVCVKGKNSVILEEDIDRILDGGERK